MRELGFILKTLIIMEEMSSSKSQRLVYKPMPVIILKTKCGWDSIPIGIK